ncbi:MAG: DUF2961 domain-containing protein [Carboxylicivirga sp.]|jgi:hypothetical protein|nr:DUF2961 domain-containing protein [Carboxylicivirga sp.]
MKKFGLLIVSTLLVLSSCNSSIDVYKQAFEREEMASLQSNWEAIMFSSYDRNSGNDDGFNGTYSKLRIENGNSVLAEVEGAGYVSRIWFTHSEHKKDGLLNGQNEHIRIFIDDKTTPAIDIPLEDVFSGKVAGFPEGLVGESLGGKYCYVPMPFSNYCRVEVEGDGVRFYQINVQKYTGEKEVIAYKPEKHEQLHQLLKIEGDKWLTEFENIAEVSESFKLSINNNGSAEHVINKPNAQIEAFSVKADKAYHKDFLKSRIKLFWDDQSEPAVDVPVNMFFGIVDDTTSTSSYFAGRNQDLFYNRFPMPFSKKATIRFETEGQALDLEIKLKLSNQPKKEWGYFTAFYYNDNAEVKAPKDGYLLLDEKGTGKYVGTFLKTEATTHDAFGTTQLPIWLEGDEIFTCDGEMRIHGTGSEDYFNCAWYSVPGRLNNAGCFPLHGFPKFDMAEMGYASAYRWHLTDPVPFTNSIQVTIEKGPTNNIAAHYESLAFYYLSHKN